MHTRIQDEKSRDAERANEMRVLRRVFCGLCVVDHFMHTFMDRFIHNAMHMHYAHTKRNAI